MPSIKENKQERLKIFVSAYACEPHLGSEIGVGWHWVLEMSKYFDLWVLTRESNRHSIEPWIAEHPEYANIHWLYYDWPRWARWWKKGMRGVRTYYNIWQICTNRIVKRTMQENDIRIFHHLTYGNALWKVSSYGQQQFFIWGPVGGLETIPKEFSKHYGWKWRLIEAFRRLVVWLLPFNWSFRRRCKNADLILCKTDITRELLPKKYQYKAIQQTDVAVENIKMEKPMPKMKNEELKLITIGRLDAWRGFDLCIEALADAIKINPNIYLTIVGNGSDYKRLKLLTQAKKLENNVYFAGTVSHSVYKEMLASSDVVVNASLKEGAVTVSFDSMALSKPIICIDTTGYTRYFSEEYARVIKRDSRKRIIEELSRAFLELSDKKILQQLSHNIKSLPLYLTWNCRGKEIHNVITQTFTDASRRCCDQRS